MKRVASIQDISCVGRCSLTVALPVLSVMGVECAVLPTAVLSTHTIFPDFTCRDLTEELLPIARHWKSQALHLDAICSGYLATPAQTEAVCEVFDLLGEKNTLIVVDPAMADHGRLYKPFAPDFPLAMKKVCQRADVLVPNPTMRVLVLTGVSFDEKHLGAMSYDRQSGQYFSYFNERVPRSFHGTGDLFAATLLGGMMQGRTLEQAMALAVDFTLACIRVTGTDNAAPWYGVEFERALPWLAEQMKRPADKQ